MGRVVMSTEPSVHGRHFLWLGALNAGVAVALGAAGTHAFKSVLNTTETVAWFALALQYHQLHAVGLVLTGLVAGSFPMSRCLLWSGWLMLLGIVLFSGGLYLLSLFDVQAVRAAIPFGGGAFIAAWALFAAGVARRPHERQSR